MTPRKRLLALGLAVAAVQLLLVAGVWIPVPHNGGDNAGYVSLAHSLLSGEGYVEAWDPARPLHTKYPPVFPALLAAAIALGARTWTALKLVPAAFTTVAVVGAYLWAARRRDPWFGAGVAALLAAGPGLLWYSHWVLSDVPFLALTMLALYALERGDDERGGGSPAWLAAGMTFAVLAYFTRSAGLPLLVAVAGWLALRKRWALLGAFGVVAGGPALAWWLRGREGGTDYVAEFWMVDPYAPERGTMGLGGLAGRAADNLGLYLTSHVPEGLMGRAPGVAAAGLALLALAAVGWALRWWPGGRGEGAGGDGSGGGRPGSGGEGAETPGWLARVHVAEIFLPLYAGLILLWPQVWSGDRFALPLFPLILFYGGDALLRLTGRFSARAVPAAGVAGLLLVGVPALASWTGARTEARACAALTRSVGAGPWTCWGPAWEAFVEAAGWSGANLPGGSSVLSRKPRIFYVTGGTPSRTYPFTAEPEPFLALADDVGARYVLLDALGRQGPLYVGGVIRARPEAFCSVAPFGEGGGGSAQLLGIVEPAAGAGGAIERGPGGPSLRIPTCPPALMPGRDPAPVPPVGWEVPLLVR